MPDQDEEMTLMNILYVSQYFPPEVNAPANRVHELGRFWVQKGHSVTVLTGFPNHPEGVIMPQYRASWRRGFQREALDGINVCRTWLYPAPNRGWVKRCLNYASFAASATLRALSAGSEVDVVIATSPQLLVGLAGYLIARRLRRPFVFEVRDLWPESLFAVGASSRRSPLFYALARLAQFLYRRADHIVVVGENQRRALICNRVAPNKISVVMNGVDENFAAAPGEAAASRQELELDGHFVVTYAGTLGMAHSLETALQAAHELACLSDILFLLVGDGAQREWLQKRSHELRLKNVRWIEKQPRERIPAILGASDACLVSLRRSDVLRSAVPSKIFEAMASGLPILLAAEGEAKEIVKKSGSGLLVPPEDPRALTKAILRLYLNDELRRLLGAQGQKAVQEKYSRQAQAADYLQILSHLVSPEFFPTARTAYAPGASTFPPKADQPQAEAGGSAF
jgi:glycosyltransferase involved in cell wall biosynthesis